jgi:hypothetical protein
LHARAAADQAVSLEGLIILDVLGELGEGVSRRGAFGSAKERHGEDVCVVSDMEGKEVGNGVGKLT